MKALVAMLTFALPCICQAQYVSGNQLYKDLKGDAIPQLWVAHGFIIGVADALEYGAPPAGMSFCIPPRVNQGQLRDITVAWLDKNPQYRHFQAHLLITKALHETFPCKK